jgi:hypothetical protein
MIYGQRNNLSMRDQAGMMPQRLIDQMVQNEEQRRKGALRKDEDLRRQRGAKNEKLAEYRDLYNREEEKMLRYYSRGGKRENVSEKYLRNLDKLKHMGQGTRRPLDMIDVFGRQ